MKVEPRRLKVDPFGIPTGNHPGLVDTTVLSCNGTKQYDANIIVVDWEKAASDPNYFDSCRDSRQVARLLGGLLELLHTEKGLAYEDVHMVGHSLGAHLAGFAGEYVQGQVGRITGEFRFRA